MQTRRAFLLQSAAGLTLLALGGPATMADEPEFTMKLATVAPSGTPWASQTRKITATSSGGNDAVEAETEDKVGKDELEGHKRSKTELKCDILRGREHLVTDLRVRIVGLEETGSGLTLVLECVGSMSSQNRRGVQTAASGR